MASVAAIVVAAGRGTRAGGGVPKQFRPLAGRPMLARAVEPFLAHPGVGPVVVVVAAGEEDRAREALGGQARRVALVRGGATRQESVRAGLERLAAAPPERVLIHDAARPLVPRVVVDRVLDALDRHPGACPALPVVDSLRTGNGTLTGEVPREGLWRVQTPQGFRFAELLAAHRRAAPGATDDAAVARAAGLTVALVPGDERAMKVTTEADFHLAEALAGGLTVTGTGFDVHRFGPGDHLWLCGVRIPHDAGLVGHSDADVALHALTDALLGAIGAGDIGVHFPPSEPQWRGAASYRFLAHAARLVAERGGRIVHADVTVIAEAPRLGPHRAAMTARVAEILADHRPLVSVKATTTEGLGFTGRREGIAAQAVATVRLPI
ncbi:MAG: bifunctional 2-C-methyl-D-erythritol 4-phosphate cytidylyltransferase/2-C-methyl-D-erythritol 2,4-cyclodiphosphate synthase [Sphingomonadaceae bacterium]|uniref:bifunctional 2-C-methyl-D-erythritol 4-phosphate cytidylyltransferase/2-C-methyl-D-erythritol 2,4-cyclodiphosphate synthase n=1 Tax=Thermaurantiacus sp. TaxID=2820283 RepID=UPI00298F0732|nr:bifunctional 2-C-methyl-D-erythritol 4-phosphate cytidylyltransferase/2-C-methyl-D-erythritol 2,4-cyclodiphosphate synthase [Thermaurantiacus sp.]MCS6985842.1 bifunctional 2-C-methyl-D-erythritol 4-phosphate cytidylyltransferase/2-C-methyl-D-erythritol 2,4-cyclodiphosphate synthase [Sphingomonadaceae bacterium]MDW8413889.1 bifunctional 2-C-methyl-D-erythritol 4-phosphate cytidylyltransferase/2-C-methyl-D-erythritol 2,4-cyclodiphosphate synthase [Thermaurantiacus sp.]